MQVDSRGSHVAADVARGAFSADVARTIFGVALSERGFADEPASEQLRAAIRADRLTWRADKTLDGQPVLEGAIQLATVGDVARIVRAGDSSWFVCGSCDSAIAPAQENWKHYARHKPATPEDLGPRVRIHADLEVVRHACPSCARQLDVEVRRVGEPSIFDFEVAA